MRYTIATLALAGVAVALPSHVARDQVVDNVQVVEQVDVVTDVVTVVGHAPAPTPQPQAPAPTTFVHVVTAAPPAPPPAPASPAPAPASPAPAAQSPAAQSSSSSDGKTSGVPTSQDMLDVSNKWRTSYNLKPFTWDDGLAAGAQKTGDDDKGTDEKHELDGEAMAQVITPGLHSCEGKDCGTFLNSFDMAYVSGWLCEAPRDSLTRAACDVYTKLAGMDLSSGETGHADILNNPDYTAIGCAFATNPNAASSLPWNGLWTCNLK